MNPPKSVAKNPVISLVLGLILAQTSLTLAPSAHATTPPTGPSASAPSTSARIAAWCKSLFTQAQTMDLKSVHDIAVQKMHLEIERETAPNFGLEVTHARLNLTGPMAAHQERISRIVERNPRATTQDALALLLSQHILTDVVHSYARLPSSPHAPTSHETYQNWRQNLGISTKYVDIPKSVLEPEFQSLIELLQNPRGNEMIEPALRTTLLERAQILAARNRVRYGDFIRLSLEVLEARMGAREYRSVVSQLHAMTATPERAATVANLTALLTEGFDHANFVPTITWQPARPFELYSHLTSPINLREFSPYRLNMELRAQRRTTERAYGIRANDGWWVNTLSRGQRQLIAHSSALNVLYASADLLSEAPRAMALKFIEETINPSPIRLAITAGVLLRRIDGIEFYQGLNAAQWTDYFINARVATPPGAVDSYMIWFNAEIPSLIE